MQQRVLNFINNWVDANIVHVSHEPDDSSTMQYRFLTDAVAARLFLNEVKASWPEAEVSIRKALSQRRLVGDQLKFATDNKSPETIICNSHHG